MLRKYLEAAAAGTLMLLIFGLLPIGIIFTIYVFFFTRYWSLLCLYYFWICVVDNEIFEKGGRYSESFRSWSLFTYVKNYFPITFNAMPGFDLDPSENYVCCSFPHGIMPIGIIITLLTNACHNKKVFVPHHNLYGLTLRSNFFIPIYREVLLAFGMGCSSAKSINWALSQPEGGRLVGIMVGGAAESFFGESGQYRLVLKNRKGFVKLAIQNGTSIIPSFAFGQNDTFHQVAFKENSIGHRVQNWIKTTTGVAPVPFYGKGIFQNRFGFIPLKKPINLVVGNPVAVTKIERPSQADIDHIHTLFIERLEELFEKYKYQFEEDPENSKLIIS